MSVYSVVNIATVVRDLARHPRGAAVATELLRAFALTADDLASLDEVRVAADAADRRSRFRVAVSTQPRALVVLAATRDVASSIGIDAWAAAADVLDTAPIGGYDDLVRFVRTDVLADGWAGDSDLAVGRHPVALDVVTDGVSAPYAADICPDITVGLARPWRRWLAERRLAPAAGEGPAATVVAAVQGATRDQLDAAAQRLRQQRADGWSWPAAMHEACWAAHLTGRSRSVAVAQLHALRAVLTVSETPPAPSVVAAIVAAVHAAAVADVLDAATVAAMTAPLDASLG